MKRRYKVTNPNDITTWEEKDSLRRNAKVEPRVLAENFATSMEMLSLKQDNLRTLTRAVQEELIAEEGHNQRYMRVIFETESCGVVDLELDRLQARKVVAMLRDFAVRDVNECCKKAHNTWFCGVSQILNKATQAEGEDGILEGAVDYSSEFL